MAEETDKEQEPEQVEPQEEPEHETPPHRYVVPQPKPGDSVVIDEPEDAEDAPEEEKGE